VRVWVAGLVLCCLMAAGALARDLERRDYATAETVYRAGNYGDAYLRLLPLAQAGNASAQFLLGRMSDNGQGPIQLDPAEAFRWYLKAALNGNGAGQFALAKAYVLGRGVGPSTQRALEWLIKAADSDYVPAILSLASLYREGHGVARDLDLAAKLQHHAAELGSPEAAYRMGEDHHVALNVDAAREWFKRAAAAGHPGALYRLAEIATVNPEATSEEKIQAFVYMTLASRRGNDALKRDARQELATIRASLSPEELAAAQTRLRNWKPSSQMMQFAAPGDEEAHDLAVGTPPAQAAARGTPAAAGKPAKR
jgi:TPR repeat protein